MNFYDDNIFQESAQPGLLSQYNFETATFHILFIFIHIQPRHRFAWYIFKVTIKWFVFSTMGNV